MSGVIAVAIKENNVQVKMKLDNLNMCELSMVFAQLEIVQTKIIKEIMGLCNK